LIGIGSSESTKKIISYPRNAKQKGLKEKKVAARPKKKIENQLFGLLDWISLESFRSGLRSIMGIQIVTYHCDTYKNVKLFP
jgi:hypothetical protein